MAFSKAWVHWEFSGCPGKDCIKEDPRKANRPRKKDSLPLHTGGGGLHSAFPSHSTPSFKANLSSPQTEAANSDPHNPSLYLGWRVERWKTQPKFIMRQWTFASDHRMKPQKWARDGGSQVRSLPPAAYLSWMRSHSWHVQGLAESIRSPQLCHFCSGEWHTLRHRAASWSKPSMLFVPQSFIPRESWVGRTFLLCNECMYYWCICCGHHWLIKQLLWVYSRALGEQS